MAHLGLENVQRLVKMADGVEHNGEAPPKVCGTCKCANLTAQPHPPSPPPVQRRPLRLIHSDVCYMPVKSVGGAKYYLVLVDEDTGFSVTVPMQTKDEATGHAIAVIKQLERQSGHQLTAFRSDKGGEFQTNILKAFALSQGIDKQSTPTEEHQSNGHAERIIRTKNARVRAVLHDSGMPYAYWAEALQTVTYLQNRSPVEGREVTPFEAFFGVRPDLSKVRVFGCLGYCRILESKREHKLSPRAETCWLLGYMPSGAYRVLLRDGKVEERMDVVWDESESYYTSFGENPPGRKKFWSTGPEFAETRAAGEERVPEPLEPRVEEPLIEEPLVEDGGAILEAEPSGSSSGSSGQQLRPLEAPEPADRGPPARPSRQHNLPQRFRSKEMHLPSKDLPSQYHANATETVDHSGLSDDPSYGQAMKRPDRHLWEQAMREELNSHFELGSLEVVDRPAGVKVLPSLWVLKRKRDAEGRIERYKARLCVMGNRQVSGVDYDSVYAPVASATTFRLLLALAARDDLELDQLDVKTAFLYGDVDREVYMSMPQGFGQEGKVFKLHRAVYGLRQAPKAWHDKLSKCLTGLGFKPATSDQSLYVFESAEGERCYLLVYVDDMLLAVKQGWLREYLKRSIAAHFDVRDLGAAKSFLGYSIERDRQRKTIVMRQSSLLASYVEQHGMTSAGPKDVPISPGTVLESFQLGEEPAPEHYASLVGSLLYVANGSRPDLSFAVSACSRFIKQPSMANWAVLRGVLKYAAHTVDVGICFNGADAEGLVGFSDSDYAGDKSLRKSVSGYVFTFCGGAICWQSKQQSVVAVSTAEAEYVACSASSKVALWLRNLLIDFGEPSAPVHMCIDNKAAFDMVRSESFTSRTKHIDIQCHHVRDHVARGDLAFTLVPSEENCSDVLTKPLNGPAHRFCCEGIGMIGF